MSLAWYYFNQIRSPLLRVLYHLNTNGSYRWHVGGTFANFPHFGHVVRKFDRASWCILISYTFVSSPVGDETNNHQEGGNVWTGEELPDEILCVCDQQRGLPAFDCQHHHNWALGRQCCCINKFINLHHFPLINVSNFRLIWCFMCRGMTRNSTSFQKGSLACATSSRPS